MEHVASPTIKGVMVSLSTSLAVGKVVLGIIALSCFVPPTRSQSDPVELLNRGLSLGDLYNWSDAGPFCIEAEQLFGATGDARNLLRAKLCRLRSTMEQLSLPQVSIDLGAELETNALLQTDQELRLFCLQIKGDIDGELDAAPMRRDWEAALSLAHQLGDSKSENRASGELGFVSFLEGNVQTSRQMVTAALLTAAKSHDVGAQMRYLSAIGTGLVLFGSYTDATGYLDRALAIATANPDAGYQFLIYEGRLKALKGLGKLDLAQRLADEMLAQAHERKKFVKEAQVLITASGIAVARGDYDIALQELQRAIELSTKGGFERLLADALFDSADIYRKRGDLGKAELMASAAAESTQSSGELYLLPQRFQSVAELQVSQGKYVAADATYDQASDFVDVMIGNVSAVSAKTGLITAMSAIYSEHFALLADHLKNTSKAYSILERARGRVVTDLLMSGKPFTRESDDGIERQISHLNLELTKSKSARDVRRIRDNLFLAEQARWLTPIGTGVSNWKKRSRDVVSLADFRASLAPNEVVLEYVLAEPHSYCLVLARDHARIVPLPNRAKIEELVSGYVKTLKKKTVSNRQGHDLYTSLLRDIPEAGKANHLIVVPDGRLHELPFDALVDDNGTFLVFSHIITYAPSASALYRIERKTHEGLATRGLLAVGGISYGEKTAGLRKLVVTRGYDSNELADLPGSREEVLAASAVIHNRENTVLLGSMGTESAFKNSHLRERKIIHLAVHGVASPAHPDRAALILLNDPGAQEDGILQAAEIARLTLTADLVVLSACDTAVGRLQGEEGISNLSRAFLLAGAKTVVSTLWSIDDTFSLFLMKRFYVHLAGGSTSGSALTAAKRDMLRTFGKEAIPYYWAGFTLNGLGNQLVNINRKTKTNIAYATHTRGSGQDPSEH